MNEPLQSQSSSHNRLQPSLSPSHEGPAGLVPSSHDEGSRHSLHQQRPFEHSSAETHLAESVDNGWSDLNDDPTISTSLGRRASASSISISPGGVTDSRVVKRRGSKRSDSSHSSSAAEDNGRYLQSGSARLTPEDAASAFGTNGYAGHASQLATSNHRRGISNDIANHGLQQHSRESSTSSPILLYHPTTDSTTRSRPQSTSAWSNFTLGEDYGADLGGSSFYHENQSTGGHVGRHPLDIDDDRQHLTASMAATAAHKGAGSEYGRSDDGDAILSDVDLEHRVSNGRSKKTHYDARNRVIGTESHYAQEAGQAPLPSISTRRKTLLSNVQRELRKLSMRVVNISQKEDEMGDHVRLESQFDEVDAQSNGNRSPQGRPLRDPAQQKEEASFSQRPQTLQGRSLGVFGPGSSLRRSALTFFQWR